MDNHYIKMTTEPVEKLVIRFSIPTIISMLVNNIYNLVDTAFVGKLGNSASGAVGVVFGFMAIMQAIGFMFGQGSGSIISRRLGHQDGDGAVVVASTGFFMSLFLGFVTAICCMIFLDPLVVALGSTPTIAPYAKKYIFFILLTAPFNVAGFTMNNILRFEGKAFYGMVGIMSGAILNIGGDAFFMLKLNMGIAGAGLSTAISQLVSFVILLFPFLSGRTKCKFSIRRICLKREVFWDIVGTGFPSLLRQGLNSVTAILLNTLAGEFGDEAVAAMSIVSRVYFFVFAAAIGVGQGFQPVSGFNYGAGKFSRVKRAYRFTVIMASIMIIVLGSVVYIKAPDLVRIFRNDDRVVEIASRALRLQAVCGLVMPFCMVSEMLFQSTGKKLMATVISALRSGILLIPTLVILSEIRGLAGIQEAQPLAYVLAFFPTLLCAIVYFKRLPRD